MTADSHTSRGRWSQAGVPHRGWSCVGLEDLGSPEQLCEMCGSADVRYVHLMAHPNFPDILSVGCVCAEHMEGDYVSPRSREKRLRNVARRRKSWSKRIWRLSRKGNPYINTDGYNVTVFRHPRPGDGWGISVLNRTSGQSQFSRKNYASEEKAKLAALDALLWAKSNL